jgi:hypothetical protein
VAIDVNRPKVFKGRRIKPSTISDGIHVGPRIVRESTKVKTIEADIAHDRKSGKVRVRSVEKSTVLLTQSDMLEEALHTEASRNTHV